MTAAVQVLVISGSMGSGKTTVLGEASDILKASGVPHAAIDLDSLGVFHPGGAAPEDLMMWNLASVWANYAATGVKKLLIAEALESSEQRERLHEAVPGAEILVCRLCATLDTMRQRIRMREPGMLQDQFVARVADLETLLDHARVEDFAVDNDSGSVTEVAREILTRAGWLPV